MSFDDITDLGDKLLAFTDGLLDLGIGVAIGFGGAAGCRKQLKTTTKKRTDQAALLKAMKDLLLFSGEIAKTINFTIEQSFKQIVLGFTQFFHGKHLR